MKRLNFRLTFKPDQNFFFLEVGDQEWTLTVEEVEEMVKRAKSDSADLTYSQIEYVFHAGGKPIWRMTGVGARETFEGMAHYITRVWNSFLFFRKHHGSQSGFNELGQ
jgi:hypothetical protein